MAYLKVGEGKIGIATISPPVSPELVSGLLLWLRADTALDAGGSQCSPDEAVTTWPDLSGNARNCTQSNASFKPLWRATGINTRPAIEFDNSNDFLAGNQAWPALSSNATVMAVTKMDTTGSHAIIDIEPGALTNQGMALFQEAGNRKFRFNAVGVSDEDAFYAFSSTSAMVHFGVRRATVNEIYEKTVLKDNEGTGAVPSFTGAGYRVGMLFEDVFPWDGMIGEIAVWDRALSTDEIASMANYAIVRYGIS